MREILRRIPLGKTVPWLDEGFTGDAESSVRLLDADATEAQLVSFCGDSKALLPLTSEFLGDEAVHKVLLPYLPLGGGRELDPTLLDSIAVSGAPDFSSLHHLDAAGFLVRLERNGTEKGPSEYFGSRLPICLEIPCFSQALIVLQNLGRLGQIRPSASLLPYPRVLLGGWRRHLYLPRGLLRGPGQGCARDGELPCVRHQDGEVPSPGHCSVCSMR